MRKILTILSCIFVTAMFLIATKPSDDKCKEGVRVVTNAFISVYEKNQYNYAAASEDNKIAILENANKIADENWRRSIYIYDHVFFVTIEYNYMDDKANGTRLGIGIANTVF